VLVLACDLPLADPLIARLARRRPGAAVGRDGHGRLQPLCARYVRSEALEACDAILSSGSPRLLSLVDALGAEPVDAAGDELANVNEPSDLERLAALSRFSARGAC
jgi:molybdopterin-guanine dinucleotide biosynthesis protein A